MPRDGIFATHELLELFSRERRRALRGLDESQLILLRLHPAPGATPADIPTLLARIAQECDSVLALDRHTSGLHLPGASPSLAQARLRKILSLPDVQNMGVAALLVTLPAALWENANPASVIEEVGRRLELCEPGARARRVTLTHRQEHDPARVTCDERSFLLSPLRS